MHTLTGNDAATLILNVRQHSHQRRGCPPRLQREIFARQGQSDFRESLIRAYRGQCAVTGCAVLPVLEAAHLQPYRGAHTNLVTNGLLLRADIHTLLDYKLWAAEPGTRVIAISRLLIGTPYNEISGRKIVEPAIPAQRPADSALEKVWREFRQAEEKRQQQAPPGPRLNAGGRDA